MINNVIIIAFVGLVFLLYNRSKYFEMLFLIALAYVLLPVIKFGGTRGLNSAYVVTLVQCVIFLLELLKKHIVLDKLSISYLVMMMAGLVVIGIGWLVNGTPVLSGLIHFAGMGQYIVGVFAYVVFIKIFNLDKRLLTRTICKGIIAANYVMALIQLLVWNIGEPVTRQLYVYAGKEAPLDVTKEVGLGFVRAFGTFYSPTVLGVVSLLMSTFFLHDIIAEGKIGKENFILYLASIGLGLLAFSKLAIIGVFLVWGLSLVFMLCQRQLRESGMLLVKSFLMIIATFVVIGSFQCLLGFKGYVNYYYFKASSISVAMSSRYQNLISSNENIQNDVESEEPEKDSNTDISNTLEVSEKTEDTLDTSEESQDITEESGNMTGSFDVFLEHPLIGVGPSAVNGEFLGDSEYITMLHNGGILTFLIYAVFYGSLIVYLFLEKKNRELFVLLVIGMGGISMLVFSYSCIIPFLAFCICNEKN